MFKKHKKRIAYGIVGLESFGMALAEELSRMGAELLLLDTDPELVQAGRRLTENAMVMDSVDEKTLTEAGIQNCDVAVVNLTARVDYSILVTLLLINMGVPKVVAKATTPMHGKILQKMGADVVYPERDMAQRLATRLHNAHVMDVVQLSEQINISKVALPTPLVGQTVAGSDLRNKYHLNIIAIEQGSVVMDSVMPDYVFCEGDILYVVGQAEGFARFNRDFWQSDEDR